MLNILYGLVECSCIAIEYSEHDNNSSSLFSLWFLCPGDPLELPEEAASEEQARGVFSESLSDLPGVRWQPAAERAVRMSQRGRPQQ